MQAFRRTRLASQHSHDWIFVPDAIERQLTLEGNVPWPVTSRLPGPRPCTPSALLLPTSGSTPPTWCRTATMLPSWPPRHSRGYVRNPPASWCWSPRSTRLRRAKARRQRPSGLATHSTASAAAPSSRCANRRWARCSGARAAQRAAASRKCFRWTRSTCTSLVIFTPSRRRTTCWRRLSTMPCIIACRPPPACRSMPAMSHGAACST